MPGTLRCCCVGLKKTRPSWCAGYLPVSLSAAAKAVVIPSRSDNLISFPLSVLRLLRRNLCVNTPALFNSTATPAAQSTLGIWRRHRPLRQTPPRVEHNSARILGPMINRHCSGYSFPKLSRFSQSPYHSFCCSYQPYKLPAAARRPVSGCNAPMR